MLLYSLQLRSLLPPLIRAFATLPSTPQRPIVAPLTHVIHSLIAIPITPALKPIWFGQHPNSPKSKTPQESTSTSRSDSPTRSNSDTPVSPKPSTLERAMSVITAGRRSLSLSRTSSPSSATPPIDVVQKVWDLLEQCMSHYFPGTTEPDDLTVRDRCKAESSDSLDDILSPLVALLSRLCFGDDGTKVRVRQMLVPDDLDRSSPLEQRADILGKCLRLLSSIYHPRLKDAVGEMLYTIADSDGMLFFETRLPTSNLRESILATTMSNLVGYGNVAGFLFHKGVFVAPQQSSASPLQTASGAAINPITGTTVQKADGPEMSDEEKEREMEKLFVLFDRLERNGALSPDQNPMRKAIQSGKMG